MNDNSLLASARVHLQRYRGARGNPALRLKTPLAVLRSSVDARVPPEELRTVTMRL